ncbi:MAG: ABC transporter permease [Nevskiaceae bacterium]|nr:MAG: ABC transporter permease [Nevskiaceae bacterium]TAM25907.1 MAG: ABC transporter permease [Nevskiaceae bacterium]
MKYFPLLWATLWRKKTRTWLTLFSLVAAFLLLGLLQAANSVFNTGGQNLGANLLITQARVSFTSPLPLRLLPQIEAVPGIEAVSFSQFFGGVYKDPKNFFPQFAVQPERWLKTFTECTLPAEQAAAWKNSRTAAIAGKQLAERFGWKVGDRIPLVSQIFPKKDGSRAWEFDLVGIFDNTSADSCPRMGNMYVRYDYFDEARLFGQGGAGIYVLRIADPDRAEAIGRQIDQMFENSPDETKTQTEKEFSLNFVRQIGNLSLILNSILGAVFFTILLLTGNTMSQAVRERIPELAVLKTLGFTNGGVLGLVIAESLLLCVIGGLVGMGLANVVMGVLAHAPVRMPPLKADTHVWMIALSSMFGVGLLVGLPPALKAMRLSIVDGLSGR